MKKLLLFFIALILATPIIAGEVRKLGIEDLEWGDPSTTVVSAGGVVSHPLDNTYKLSAHYVDVRAYLPVGYVTDGSVEYTTYAQSALDNVGVAGGGSVVVPLNFTLLSNRLNIRYSNVHLIIQGTIQSVAAASLSAPSFSTTGGLINVYPATYTYGVEGVKITDVSVEGPGSIVGPYPSYQAYTTGKSAIVVESCNYFTARGLRVSGFAAENILVGPATKSHYATIENNKIVGGGDGVGITKSYGSMVKGNRILNSYSQNGIGLSGSFSSAINNYIDNAYLNGISMGGSSGDNATYMLLAQGNKIYRSAQNVLGVGIFINEDDATFPVQVGHIIDSNHVYKSQGGYGIVGLVNNADSVITISNNTVSDTVGPTGIGIWVDGAATFIVTGNTVFPGSTGNQAFGIRNGATYGTSKGYFSNNAVFGHAIQDIGKVGASTIAVGINNSPGGSITWNTAYPTDNTVSHSTGEIVINTGQWEGTVLGWICTGAGSPGVWTPFYSVYGTPTDNQVVTWDNTGQKAYWKTP